MSGSEKVAEAPEMQAPVSAEEDQEKPFKIQVYVDHGYYQYRVKTAEKAMAHAEAIMKNQVYRHACEDGSVECLHANKVKVVGPGLASQYLDTFHRT